MKRDVDLAIAIFLSIPLSFLLFYILSPIWVLLFPSVKPVLDYASRFSSPVHVALPIGSAIFFFLLFEWMDREKIGEPRNAITLLLFLLIVFLSYYVGISGFYFFRFLDLNLHTVAFIYFLYVPYWTVLAGLLSAWLLYTFPSSKLFKIFSTRSKR